MRRLFGLIALLALIYGAVWLVQNGYDMTRIAREMAWSEPSPAGGDATTAPEAVAEPPAAVAPAPAPDAAPAEEDVAGPPEEPAGSRAFVVPDALPADSATAEPPVDDAPGETAPAVGSVPTFDIVRVEPSGETVIAGLAAPNTKVEVLDGPEPLATAEANERGEWALVLDAPLPPGTHDLAIRTTSDDKSVVTLSDQRVAVSVPEGAGEEPLVVLSTPEAPSAVIQVPEELEVASAPQAAGPAAPEVAATAEPEPSAPTPEAVPEIAASPEAVPEIAAAPPGEPARPPAETEAVGTGTPAPSVEAPDAVVTAPAEETPEETQESEVAAAAPDVAEPETAPPAVATDAASGPEAAPETVEEAAAPPASTVDAPASQPETAGEGEATPPVAEEAPAPPAPPVAEEAPAEPEPQIGVAAVEAETGGALYVAGTATTKDPVRVYLDGELIGEAGPTDGGTWLVETNREIAPGDYTIRADQVDAGTGQVIVRAEVPFEREIVVVGLKQSGESGDPGAAEVSGSIAGPMTVIIKRGDNLWRISRELYGHGLRYSTIYQANLDQIRDPDRIYPGQVFVLPAGDTAWQN